MSWMGGDGGDGARWFEIELLFGSRLPMVCASSSVAQK